MSYYGTSCFTLVQRVIKLWCSMSYQRFTTPPESNEPFQ